METHALAAVSPTVLGERLAGVRHALGLTEQQAADAIGVSRSEIAAIENGERRPRAKELVKLAQHYRRPVNEFVRAVPQPFTPTGRVVSQHDTRMAVQAYVASDLTETQLARYLGTDIVGAREIVRRSGLDLPPSD